MKLVPGFEIAIGEAQRELKSLSYRVHTEKWQGMDISQKPEMETYEILNHSFMCPIGTDNLDILRKEIRPNLPWADDHFEERVAGDPLNPGVQWANWPYAASADRFRTAGDMKFSHTYMERYWPKHAGRTPGGDLTHQELWQAEEGLHRGIRYEYGDLMDVVRMLAHQPLTRQAFLPVWFPEDTGVLHGGRVPCTIGYHFMMRNGFMHVGYWLRSCDFVRHFRDDIYLTVRLALWVIEQCRVLAPDPWAQVGPGMYSMWMTSLHMFKNDYRVLFGREHG